MESIFNYFKNLFTADFKQIKFIGFLLEHITYIWIGLALAALVVAILIFVTKQFPQWPVIIVILIPCLALSLFVGWLVDLGHKDPDPVKVISGYTDSVDAEINKNYGLTNGGFSYPQIEKVQADDEAPTANDYVIELTVKDFGNYVDFYYLDIDGTYRNAVFLKYEDGLVYDGILNTSCGFTRAGTDWYNWIFGIFKTYDLNSFSWETDYATEPVYKQIRDIKNTHVIWPSSYDNLLTDSRLYDLKYWFNNKSGVMNWNECKKLLVGYDQDNRHIAGKTEEYIGYNINYFKKFDDVELINFADPETLARKNLNSFYTYLWKQMEGVENDTQKLIDVSHLMCRPIAEDMQENYPISQTAKQNNPEYANKEYYGVYKCNIAVNCTFKTGKEIAKSNSHELYIQANNDKPNLKYDEKPDGESLSNVNIKFTNSHDCDLTNLNLENNPITITFRSTELEKTKTLVISNKRQLINSNCVLLNKGTNWTYEISSSVVVFEGYEGSFRLTADSSELNFNFQYYDDKIGLTVGLNLIGTLNMDELDLANNPTRIIIRNATKTYQFVFNSNDLINQRITQVVEPGEYEYTILSTELIFAQETGSITVTTTNNLQLFNYTQSLDWLQTTILEDDSVFNDVVVFIDSDLDERLIELLGNDFDGVFRVYDLNGSLIVEKSTSNGRFIDESGEEWIIDFYNISINLNKNSELEEGKTYYIQATFFKGNLSYSAQIIEFIKSSHGHRFYLGLAE